jgi:hypothetical protein
MIDTLSRVENPAPRPLPFNVSRFDSWFPTLQNNDEHGPWNISVKEECSTLKSRRIGRLHGSRAVDTAPCPETSNFNWDPMILTGHQPRTRVNPQDKCISFVLKTLYIGVYRYRTEKITPSMNRTGHRRILIECCRCNV